jgi:hypothetical protein
VVAIGSATRRSEASSRKVENCNRAKRKYLAPSVDVFVHDDHRYYPAAIAKSK